MIMTSISLCRIYWFGYNTHTMYEVIGIFVFSCLVNIPFGMLRGKQKPYTLKWFLYIHLSVPLIFLARHYTHTSYFYIPLFMFAAMLGQYVGAKRL